ncbi:MAG: S41 family peptidase [Bacteroidales bacterium]|jgi:carboxyl-terminal processing protease|nr:S41 family peptidase [Bacteroidales bacterium]
MRIKNLFTGVRKTVILISLVIATGGLFAFTISEDFKLSKNLEIYFSVIKNLSSYYVDGVDSEKLIKKSIDSMLEELDPYTTYIPENELSDLQFVTTGKYGGIGSGIRKKGHYAMIAEPYENTPAHKAGLKAGDIILEINGKSVKDLPLDKVSSMLKGTPESDLVLFINREASKDTLTIKLVRKEISIPTVQYSSMITDSVGYINLSGFKSNSNNEVLEAYNELKKNKNLNGIIIDLRGNLGGLLGQAVEIANLFVPKNETIVTTRGKDKTEERSYATKKRPVDTKIPIVFLVSRSTASSSEILAGSFQDMDRGVIIGQRTFGKGLVQKTIPMSYNTILKVTTAKYYIPSGRCVQAIDFSHRNDDGSVGFIPDSLISEFKTRNGRIVKDGGGITPDIKIEPEYLSKLSVELIRQNMVFDFATKYAAEHPSIPAVKDFNLTDKEYQDFITFVNNHDFKFETETEKEIDKVIKIAKKEKYYEKSKDLFKQLKDKFSKEESKDFITFKDEIVQMIKQEIVTRYYFRRGLIEVSLSEDKTVKEAVNVLRDPDRYKEILKN